MISRQKINASYLVEPAPAGHADALGLVGAGILRPVSREHILCFVFISHAASFSRPRLMAPRTAASQLGPAFNFGGLSADAGLICDPSDRATNVIPTAKAIMVILICSSQRHNPDRQLW